MTAKDLHFSFDDAQIRRQSAPTREASAAPQRTSPKLAAQTQARPQRQPSLKSTKAPTPRGHWGAVAGIALVNMAFLVLAGLWVTGNAYHIGNAATSPAPDNSAALAPALAELRQGVVDTTEELGRELDSQLQSVRSALQEQGQILATLQAEISGLRAAVAPEPAAADLAQKAPAAAKWHINLGSFPTKEVALELQQQMQALGHTVDVDAETLAGATNYLVRLQGFADRASADTAAKRIMEQTSLNGLWVWNGE